MLSFPFSALVGQETLKRALILSVIQPSLGGVLIRGTKGVAKSTAVRALANLLPPIETVSGCPFQRRPGEEIPDWPLPADSTPIARPVPLVELPLGATEDRVLGSLHLERALRGERAYEPGLLAAANRGILYIDEVNLLPDHLVDILLDAAASGIHRVEREGLSLSHPARFVLIGTMNPEEGELRPQLLDRFGLVVDVADLSDPADRAEAVRRRMAFEADPLAFQSRWQEADAAEAERILQAQQLLPRVQISDVMLRQISERCRQAGVEGLRADLTVCKAACAWAAHDGRAVVEPKDVEAVAELALAHRRTRPPQPPGPGGNTEHGIRDEESKDGRRQAGVSSQASGIRNQESGAGSQNTARTSRHPPPATHFESAGLFTVKARPAQEILAESPSPGRWRNGASPRRQVHEGMVRNYEAGCRIAWAATLRAAALRGEMACSHATAIHRSLQAVDLRGWPRSRPTGCLLLFVVDTSGSMAAWQRMRLTKAAILSLLVQAYQRRDHVAILAFHGSRSELVLPPTRGLRLARRAIEKMLIGGQTPLAHGLKTACEWIRVQHRRQLQQPVWTVVLTDGRANVPLHSSDPWGDALLEAERLANVADECLVVDTETGWPRLGRAAELGRAMKARSLSLDDVLGKAIPRPWREAG